MKKIILLLSLCFAAISCDLGLNPDNQSGGLGYSVNGNVQKGPFTQGTSITIQALDDALNPTGKNYQTKTVDDAGTFGIDNQIDSRYVEIIATGYYFNEISGRVSNSTITLRALSDLTESGKTNVNLLTTLEIDRVRHLVVSEGMSVSQAREMAEKELFDSFHIPEIVSVSESFDKMDITRGGDANAILLAISATLQGKRSEGELSELVAKIAAELRTAGKIDNASIQTQIRDGGMSVDASSVRRNLENRYKSLGITDYEIPPFEDYLDVNGNGVIDKHDSWLILSKKDVFVSDEGGSFDIEVQHNLTCDVMIEVDSDGWISQDVTKSYLETDKLSFTVSANEDYDPRCARIVVKDRNSELVEYVNVTQKQHDALSVTSDYVSLPREGGNFQVEVKSNMDVSVEIPANTAAWITPAPATKGLVTYVLEFSASRNDEPDNRLGKIILRSGELQEEVTVCQHGERVLLADRNDFTVSCERQNVVVHLTSNLDCNVVMPSVDWLRRTALTRSLVTSDLVFEVDANEGYDSREAQILVQAAGMQESIRIAQLQKDAIIVGADRYEVSYEGGVVDVALSSNVKYEVSVADGVVWIECLPATKSLMESVVSLNVARNDGLLERVGTVTISNTVSGISNTVTIVQGGNIATLEVDIPTAGTLSEILTDIQKANIVNMKVTGTLNKDDFKTMEAMPKLTELDLSGAAVQGNVIPEEAMTSTKTYYGVSSYVSQSNLHKLILPEGIVSIGKAAFACVPLDTVILPTSLSSIKESAFYCSDLTEVTIPADVILIESDVFAYNKLLTSVYFAPDSKLKRLEGYIGRNVLGATLFHGVFSSCSSLTRVEIPASVNYIGAGTFCKCSSLKELIIPDDTSLSAIEGYFYKDPNPLVEAIYGGLFEYCTSLNEIRIPAKIRSLDKYAFVNSGIRKVVFAAGSQCEKIGEQVFSGCNALESIDLPTSVNTIGDRAFLNCSSLKSLDLSMVETIGIAVLSGCSELKDILLPKSITEICERMFEDCSVLETVAMPSSVTKIGKYAFGSCSSLKSLPVTDGLTEICEYAFAKCASLKNIVIPQKVSLVGESAFYMCENLTEVHLAHQDSIVLGASLFRECNRLSDIELCAKKIVPGAGFLAKTNVYELELPEEVEFWGAPYYCGDVEFVTSPIYGSVPEPFAGSMVASIKFANNSRLKECGAGAFAGAESLPSLTLPSSVETLGMGLFQGDKILVEFNIPSHVKKITGPVYGGSYILSPQVEDSSRLEYVGNYGLVGITDEHLDLSNCAYIGFRALSCCDNLKSVTLKRDGTLYIGSKVFAKTPNVKEFVIPRGLKELRTTMVNGDRATKYSTQPFYESAIETISSEDNACLEYSDVYFSSETLKTVDFSGITSASLTFANFSLESYTKYIGCSSLETLLLPRVAELNSLPTGVFYKSTGLTKLMIPASIIKLSLKLSDSSITELVSEKGGEGFELVGTLQEAKSLKSVDVDLLNVPDKCFLNCPSLESLNLPKAKTVGKYVFLEKSKDVNSTLKSLNLPVVETIGDYAFWQLVALTDLSLPEVTSIGFSAFSGCTALQSFDAPKLRILGGVGSSSWSTASSSVFSGCISLAHVSLGPVAELGNKCFYNCASLKQANFHSVEKIGDNAFYGCSSLERVEFGQTLKSIGKECFMNCSALKSISIPNCTSVGISAFKGCSNLEGVEANALKNIGDYAFSQCAELQDINISAVKSIGKYAFSQCVELRSINLSTVESIGDYAFEGCCKLDEIAVSECEELGTGAFAGCTGISQEILILGVCTKIGDNCFSDLPKLTTLDLTKGLLTRSSQCFPATVKVVINRDKWPGNCPLNAFSLMNLPECTLYVPAAVMERYKSKDGWTNFGQILPIE